MQISTFLLIFINSKPFLLKLAKAENMNTTQQLRLSIIDIITKIEDINILQSMYAKLSQETKQQKNDNLPAFLEAVTNIRTNVSLEQLMTEQNYKIGRAHV